jgi:hypothetical protein
MSQGAWPVILALLLMFIWGVVQFYRAEHYRSETKRLSAGNKALSRQNHELRTGFEWLTHKAPQALLEQYSKTSPAQMQMDILRWKKRGHRNEN